MIGAFFTIILAAILIGGLYLALNLAMDSSESENRVDRFAGCLPMAAIIGAIVGFAAMLIAGDARAGFNTWIVCGATVTIVIALSVAVFK